MRVSIEISKNKGNSIGNQFNKVKGFCGLNHFELVDIIKDKGESGMVYNMIRRLKIRMSLEGS